MAVRRAAQSPWQPGAPLKVHGSPARRSKSMAARRAAQSPWQPGAPLKTHGSPPHRSKKPAFPGTIRDKAGFHFLQVFYPAEPFSQFLN